MFLIFRKNQMWFNANTFYIYGSSADKLRNQPIDENSGNGEIWQCLCADLILNIEMSNEWQVVITSKYSCSHECLWSYILPQILNKTSCLYEWIRRKVKGKISPNPFRQHTAIARCYIYIIVYFNASAFHPDIVKSSKVWISSF